MSTTRLRRSIDDRARWCLLTTCFTAVALVWAVGTPLFTGPDEVSQARRAAAVVRGQLTGDQERPGPALLLSVDVPPLYGDPAEQQWLCHLGPLVPGTPQTPMLLPEPPCPDLDEVAVLSSSAGSPVDTVRVETVQYRGQPFFYAVAGLPTLISEGLAGAYGMRLAAAVLSALLFASAAMSAASALRPRLGALGLAVCFTPGVAYLAGSTNPSAVEIAASLSAWAAMAMLASSPMEATDDVDTGRLVRRLGTALVVLALCRGLGPAFVVAVVAVGFLAAGPRRWRELGGRRDVRLWSTAVSAAIGVSGLWLAYIGQAFALPERPGSGAADALGWLGWYVRQSVGVFGSNDSAVDVWAVVLWGAVTVSVMLAGLVDLARAGRSGSSLARALSPGPGRAAVLALAVFVAGLALNVTAEGLSLPPIGFFWQGRYALPLLFGGILLATVRHRGLAPRESSGDSVGAPATVVSAAAFAALVGVHAHGFVIVAQHHGSPRGLALAASAAVYLAALAGIGLGLGLGAADPHPGDQG